jgi:hypothetical protein
VKKAYAETKNKNEELKKRKVKVMNRLIELRAQIKMDLNKAADIINKNELEGDDLDKHRKQYGELCAKAKLKSPATDDTNKKWDAHETDMKNLAAEIQAFSGFVREDNRTHVKLLNDKKNKIESIKKLLGPLDKVAKMSFKARMSGKNLRELKELEK